MGAKTMLYGECGGVLLCVHTEESPSHEEWAGYVEYCARLPVQSAKTLVVTEGGGPDAAQRKLLQERYLDVKREASGGCLVAVMTDSALVRGIVKALNWFNRGTDSFPYADGAGMAAALKHLELDILAAHRVRVEIEVMRRELARDKEGARSLPPSRPPVTGASPSGIRLKTPSSAVTSRRRDVA